MGEVKGTKYLLKIRNHAPQKTKNRVPPLFFEKAGDNKDVPTGKIAWNKVYNITDEDWDHINLFPFNITWEKKSAQLKYYQIPSYNYGLR